MTSPFGFGPFGGGVAVAGGGEIPEIPGDPDTLRGAAHTFSAAGSRLRDLAGDVTSQAAGAGDTWAGIAAMAFGALAREQADAVGDGAASMNQVSAALVSYAAALEAAKRRRDTAARQLADARQAHDDAARAQSEAGDDYTGATPESYDSAISQALNDGMQAYNDAEMAARRATHEFAAIAGAAPTPPPPPPKPEAKPDEPGFLERAWDTALANVGRGTPLDPALSLAETISPGFREDFGRGIIEDTPVALWNTGVTLVQLHPTYGLIDPGGRDRRVQQLEDTVAYARKDPGGFLKQMVGWDQVESGHPGRFAGNLFVDGALLAAGGAGVASRGTRVVSKLGDLRAPGGVARTGVAAARRTPDEAVRAANRFDPESIRNLPERQSVVHDYSRAFDTDRSNYERGIAVEAGPADDPMTIVQYYDTDNPKSSMKWWAPIDDTRHVDTMEEARQRYALNPDWEQGHGRDAARVAHIPKGTDVTFMKGRAAFQETQTGVVYEGGGVQYRFKEFDEAWIVAEYK